MNQIYHIFGLNIQSDIPLPANATPEHRNPHTPDVVIEIGNTPSQLAMAHHKGVRFQAAPGEFLLHVDLVARYYVTGGKRIVIAPEQGADEERILIFLMGSAFGALLHQRNILVLHAGAIAAHDQSILFSGHSGIGKSTLAAGFHKRGYPFLADDVCAITLVNDKPYVIPGFPRLKLWADVLKKLDKDKEQLKSVRWTKGLDKYFMPVETLSEAPVPLKTVFILETTNTGKMEIIDLQGAQKIGPLLNNTYRIRFLNGPEGKKEHFRQCAAVAMQANVHRVIRPTKGFLLDELMDLLEAKFT